MHNCASFAHFSTCFLLAFSLLPSGFSEIMHCELTGKSLNSSGNFSLSLFFLICYPITTRCPSVSCSPVPLWLFFSLPVLCMAVSLSASVPAVILLINSSSLSTFTAQRDRQREGAKEGRREQITNSIKCIERDRESVGTQRGKHQQGFRTHSNQISVSRSGLHLIPNVQKKKEINHKGMMGLLNLTSTYYLTIFQIFSAVLFYKWRWFSFIPGIHGKFYKQLESKWN